MTRYLALAIVNQEVYLSCFRGTRKPCQSPTNKDWKHEDHDMIMTELQNVNCFTWTKSLAQIFLGGIRGTFYTQFEYIARKHPKGLFLGIAQLGGRGRGGHSLPKLTLFKSEQLQKLVQFDALRVHSRLCHCL